MRPRATVVSLLLLTALCSVGLATAQPSATPHEPASEVIAAETATAAGAGPVDGTAAVDRRPDSRDSTDSTNATNATESTVSDPRRPDAADGAALRTAPAVGSADGPAIEITHVYGLHPRDDDRVLVRLDVTVPENVRELRFDRPAGLDVTDAGDFERDGSRYRWRNDERARQTVSLTVAATLDEPGADSYRGGDWAFVGGDLGLTGIWSATYVGEMPRWERTGTVDDAGIAGTRAAVLDDYEELTRTVYGQRIRVIVPAAAEMEEPPERVLESLAFESRHVRVGNRVPELLVFVAPEPVRNGGKSLGNGEVWVHQEVTLARNSWGHEYVHTRQGYEAERDAVWLKEAEAEYLENQLAYRQGHIGERSAWSDERLLQVNLERGARDRHEDVVLAEPGTWARHSNYRKGALVLAALDLEIRDRTDGERTYQDVLRELNDRGTVDHATFADAVETVAGEPMDDFLDRYVTGSGTPPVPGETELATLGQGDREFDADLAVSLAGDDETTVTKGETVTLPVGVENAGSDPAVAVEAVLEVPAEWEVVDGGEATADGGVTWTKRELAPGERFGGDVTLRVPADAPTGTDRLSLTARDADGNAVAGEIGAEAVGPPSAAVAVDGVAVAGEPVALDASGSDADGAITAYRWDWTGDGTADATTADPTVAAEFGEPGERRVAVAVVDEYGNVDHAGTSVVVVDAPSVTASGPESVVEGAAVELEATVEKEVGDYEVTWTFPDGTTGTGAAVERTLEPGEHRIEVSVVDEYGLEASDTVDVVVTDVPTVAVDGPAVVPAGEPVGFEATVENAVGDHEVTWTFPDGETETGASVEHAVGVGRQGIEVTVTDEYGATDTATDVVTGNDRPGLAVDAPGTVLEGEPVVLTATVENAVGETAVRWELPGGERPTGESVTVDLDPGEHEIGVVARDEYGASADRTVTVTVADEPAVTVTGPDEVAAGEPVTLEATVENAVGDHEVTWTFPDGKTETGTAVEHAFEPGDHRVEVVVTDEHGATGNASFRVSAAVETDGSGTGPESDESGADDLPGFGALAALVALVALAGLHRPHGR